MSLAADSSGSDSSRRESELKEVLTLKALPATGEAGLPLTHDYFEIVYAPLIGPTAVLLARTMARHLEATDGSTTVCPVDLAFEVGVRASHTDPLGKKSHLVHAIDRLVHDRIVVRLGDGVLGVRIDVPPLGAQALAKLPVAAREAHQRYMSIASRALK